VKSTRSIPGAGDQAVDDAKQAKRRKRACEHTQCEYDQIGRLLNIEAEGIGKPQYEFLHMRALALLPDDEKPPDKLFLTLILHRYAPRI